MSPADPSEGAPDAEPGHDRMQIGELARLADVSHRTIHFYERLNLVQPSQRDGGGYRYYDRLALARLMKVRQLKQLGLSLEEIADVIDLYFADQSGVKGKEKVIALLQKQLAETDAKIADMQQFRSDLTANIARLQGYIDAAKAGDAPT